MRFFVSFLILSGLLAAGTAQAQSRAPEPANIPGRAGINAHQAQKARAANTTGTVEEADGSAPGITPTGSAQNVSSQTTRTAGSAGGTTVPSRPAQAEPVAQPAPLTNAQIAAAKRAAEVERTRAAKPVNFHWPRATQPALGWNFEDRDFDGFTLPLTILRTPRHTLAGKALTGYQPPAAEDSTPGKGLELVNTSRSNVRLEFYTFRGSGFLPDLEAGAIEAYQRALPEQFGQIPLQLVDPAGAKQRFGPGVADRLTRVVRFRIYPDATGKEPEGPAIDAADYLIPLDNEWLVVRFFAPVQLFAKASESVESFLECLELEDGGTHTAAR